MGCWMISDHLNYEEDIRFDTRALSQLICVPSQLTWRRRKLSIYLLALLRLTVFLAHLLSFQPRGVYDAI
jgi:hypothetical protein